MPINPASTPSLGKRQHSSNGGSSGPSSPRQPNAAGTAFSNKKLKLDDGEVIMDVDLETKDTSVLTLTPDESHLEGVNIPTSFSSSEITGTMTLPTVESPRSICSSVTHIASPTARKASSRHLLHPTIEEKVIYGSPSNDAQIQPRNLLLHAKVKSRKDLEAPTPSTGDLDPRPGDEVDTVSSPTSPEDKIEAEERRISHPNSGSELYDRLVAENYIDPVKAWFAALSLPCHPEQVEIPSKSTTTTDGSPDVTSSAGLEPVGGSKGSGKYFTPCTAKQSTLMEHCNWKFLPCPDVTDPPTDLSSRETYKEKYQYKGQEGRMIHNIEDRPECQLDPQGKPLKPLSWLIENHLLREAVKMAEIYKDAPLLTPKEWKDELLETAKDPPIMYNTPSPDPYRDYREAGSKFRQKRPSVARSLHPTTHVRSPSPEATSPPSYEPESLESIAARAKVEKLKEEYHPDKFSKRKEKVEAARKFDAALAEMNLPYKKYKAKSAAVAALREITGYDCRHRSQSRRTIRLQDQAKCCGDITRNENTLLLAQYPPFIIKLFLEYDGEMKDVPSEPLVEKSVGGLLYNVVTGEGMFVSHGTSINFPLHLTAIGSSAKPDLCVRVRAALDIGWPKSLERMLPVLYVGEAKKNKTLNVENIRAQIAAAFHETLVILILYYLDTRKELTSDLPPWLFLYGIEYYEYGVNICAHYPSYEFDGNTGHWELHSMLITQDYASVFVEENNAKRLQLLSILYKIQSHCLFVLEQLRNWDRAEDVLGVIQRQNSV